MQSKTFFLEKLSDGTIRLKRNHDYFIQVQGQLYVASDLNIESIHGALWWGNVSFERENCFGKPSRESRTLTLTWFF